MTSTTAGLRAVSATLVLLSSHACSQEHTPGESDPEQTAMARPEYLPQTARDMLRKRMKRHAQYATKLSLATITLRFDDVRHQAENLLAEPQLSRPLGGDATMLNSLLPEKFFDFQDKLAQACRAVIDAAEEEDSKALVLAHTKLSSVCVGCHSAYLSP